MSAVGRNVAEGQSDVAVSRAFMKEVGCREVGLHLWRRSPDAAVQVTSSSYVIDADDLFVLGKLTE